jgi:murein DD-endopeptidase MepM/ murein hydrolase activator NlpD
MKRRGTIFGPFVAAAIIGLCVALVRVEPNDEPIVPDFSPQQMTTPVLRTSARAPMQRLRARLMIPVEGVTRDELHDTWGDARSEGRAHEGIDILAPQGAHVYAVANGRIVKFFDSERGGVTIYQFDHSERFVYYYAHLSARAAGLLEGAQVRQGEVIGYVGMTGNAPIPHLHFEIQRLTAEKRWWVAEAMNPYPYLMTGAPPA